MMITVDPTQTNSALNLHFVVSNYSTTSVGNQVGLITLPSSTTGSDFTVNLTGAAVNSGADQILYSTTAFAPNTVLTTAQLASFVPASSITNWSSVRSVVVEDNTMASNAVVGVTLPIQLVGATTGESVEVDGNSSAVDSVTGDTLMGPLTATINTVENSTVTVDYVDQSGKQILSPFVQTAPVGSSVTFTAPSIYGYQLVGSSSQNYTVQNNASQKVTFVYSPVSVSEQINLIDQSTGNSLGTLTASGLVGQTYDLTTVPTPSGYTASTLNPTSFTFGNVPGVVHNLFYMPGQVSVNVLYEDGNGNQLLPSQSITGAFQVGSTINVPAPTIPHYNMTSTVGGAGLAAVTLSSSTISNGVATVIVQYSLKQSAVTIHYVDSLGNTLLPDKTLTGSYGNSFSISQPTIAGHTFSSTLSSPTTGTYSLDSNDQINTPAVTLVYLPQITTSEVNITGGSKTYDGAAIANAATVNLPSGLSAPALTQETDYTVSGADSNLKNVGTYKVTLTAVGLAKLATANPNYDFSSVNPTAITTNYVLNKANATITGTSTSQAYDGKAVQPTATVTGAVNGETITYAPLSTVGPNIGTYTVTPVAGTTGVDANYNITVQSGTVTITPATITNTNISMIGGSKTYDGTSITNAATVGLPSGLNVPALSQGTDYIVTGNGSNLTNAGTYKVTLTAVGLAKLATANPNYDFSSVNPTAITTNYVLNKANATITGTSTSQAYDGKAVQPTATVTGAVNGETITYAPLSTVGPNIGTYTVTPVADTTGINANYNITVQNGTVTITPSAITNADVTMVGGSKTYDGAAITNAATITLPTGLTVPALTQGTDYTVSGPDSNLKNVGTYTATLTAAGLAKIAAANTNYDFSSVNPTAVTTSYVVNKANATITGVSINHVYDGNTVQPTATFTGEVSGETLSYAPMSVVGPNVGTYTVTPVASTTGANANYNITVVEGNVTIVPAALTNPDITMTSGSKTYDGNPITNAATVSLPEGLMVPNLTQGVDYTVTGTDESLKDAGTYTVILTSAGLTKLANVNTNYDFNGINPSDVTTSYVVGKASAEITTENEQKVEGSPDPTLAATTTGVIKGDTLNYTVERQAGENPGTYVINAVLGDNPNYNVTVNPAGVLTISALVKVQCVDQNGTPISSYNVTGNVGDNVALDSPTLDGYQILDNQPSNYLVTYSPNQVVTVEYRQNAEVTANYYLVGTTQELAMSQKLDGGVGLDYATTPIEINGYTLSAVPENESGQYTASPIAVNYYYNVNYSLNGQTTTGTSLNIPADSGTGEPGQPITNVPEVTGYTVVGTPVVPTIPGQVTVEYAPNNENATVSFVDETTGETLSTKDLTGKFNSSENYDIEAEIANYLNQGYKLVSNNYPANGEIYNQDGVTQQFQVDFSHVTAGITSTNPGKPGSSIETSNPNGPKWPQGSGVTSLTKDVTETIHFADGSGKQVAQNHVSVITFTRTGTVDEVTGQVTYSAWVPKGSNTFASVNFPVVKGYYASGVKSKEITGVTANSSNITETVIYKKMGHLTINVPGAPVETYPNNPQNPSEAGNPTIPNIPGYTPVDGNGHPLVPGTEYPINTAEPGMDVTIRYVKNGSGNQMIGTSDKQEGNVDLQGNTGLVKPVSTAKSESVSGQKSAVVQNTETISKNRLPQTGEDEGNEGTVVGLSMLGLVSGFLALLGIRRKKN